MSSLLAACNKKSATTLPDHGALAALLAGLLTHIWMQMANCFRVFDTSHGHKLSHFYRRRAQIDAVQ